MRSDVQIQSDLMAELKWEPSLDEDAIQVFVKDGVVTLNGQVPSYIQKWIAERTALGVFGVKALTVQLTVNLPQSSVRSDADIARLAQSVLSWNSLVPDERLKIMVENGWITISGEVQWDFEKRAAVKTLSSLFGVTGLTDLIHLTRKPRSPLALKTDIEAALRRSGGDMHPHIDVIQEGDCITLSGTVHNDFERSMAKRIAWRAPGVQTVVDHLQIG